MIDDRIKKILLRYLETQGWYVLNKLHVFGINNSNEIVDTILELEKEAPIQLPIKLRENTWLKTGGWGNGYVKLPKGHKYYGMDYSDIHVDAPGGLTYSVQEGDEWVVGFDTMHYWNNSIDHNKDYVLTQTILLLYELYNT